MLISHDESGMAMDILFKPRVEAKQHNGTDDTRKGISQSKNQRERKIASKGHVCSTCFLFSFYFTLENINGGNLCVESSSTALFSIS